MRIALGVTGAEGLLDLLPTKGSMVHHLLRCGYVSAAHQILQFVTLPQSLRNTMAM
jgi:hypothetical protein